MTALMLGLCSFGGPTAHIGYFHHSYVVKKKWVTEDTFNHQLALSQLLPGPASSQLGMAIAWHRAGPLGAFTSWLGFTLPSAVLMALAAFFMQSIPPEARGLLSGLKLVAFAVLSHALITMGRSMLTRRELILCAIGAVTVGLIVPGAFTQVSIILIAGLWGFLRSTKTKAPVLEKFPRQTLWPLVLVGIFLLLLAVLPVLRTLIDSKFTGLFDIFYRAGALVFGGGHVVLPLLQDELVGNGLVSADTFMSAYAIAQAVPGPLFTLSSYIGMDYAGIYGAILGSIAIFLPSYLIILGVLPVWTHLSRLPRLESTVKYINAAVVGILALAWYKPIAVESIHSVLDLTIGLGLLGAIMFAKWPPWLVLIAGASLGILKFFVLP